MTTSLSPAARLAWWATAWLRGLVVTDLLLDALSADDALHVAEDGGSLTGLLGRLRGPGATGCGLALPVDGDPLGLGGPRELNEAALLHGAAVVCAEASLALVPVERGEVVTWHAFPASPRQLPDVGEADRLLRGATLDAVERLAALDVARWRPEVADLLSGPAGQPLTGPPGTPARCVALAGRAVTARAVVDLALADDGAAVSATQASRRREALLPLERAARRALVAACSPEVWPPDEAAAAGR